MEGCLLRHKRAKGDCWVLRYRDGDTNRKENLAMSPMTHKQAQQKADEIVGRMNTAVGVTIPRTVAELVIHYRRNELPLKATCTQAVYGNFIDTWIVPKWGASLFRSIDTMPFENCSDNSRPNGTQSKIKNIMSAIYTHAQRYKFCKENPIMLVRQSASGAGT